MGSHSYTGTCSRCGSKNYFICEETRQINVSAECLDCGTIRFTQEDRMSLEEVNELRKDMEMKPLKKLAEVEE
mgnify:CR=1 FL=1